MVCSFQCFVLPKHLPTFRLDSASKSQCMQAYVALLWEQSGFHQVEALSVPEVRIDEPDTLPLSLPDGVDAPGDAM